MPTTPVTPDALLKIVEQVKAYDVEPPPQRQRGRSRIFSSLARAALPYVLQLRWGWHRVEGATERGKVSLDALFERAFTWCCECLPVGPVRLGRERRTVHALDSSTIGACAPRSSGARCWAEATAIGPSGRCRLTSWLR